MYCTSSESIGYGEPDFDLTDYTVLTTSKRVYSHYKDSGISVESFSAYLGITCPGVILTLYQIYDFYFEGYISNNKEMLSFVFRAFIDVRPWGYCVAVADSFCWFKVTVNGIHKLGLISMDEPISNISVGSFIKRLRYSLVSTDVSLKALSFLSYGKLILSDYCDKYVDLRLIFSGVNGLSNESLLGVYNQLSDKISVTKRHVSAEDLVSCLSDSSRALGASFENGDFRCRSHYYKDYSSCKFMNVQSRELCYFFVIDCEGVTGGDGSLQAGCRQLGIMLCAKYRELLIPLHSIVINSELIVDSLLNIPSMYRNITDHGIPAKGVPTCIYGVSDKVMIESVINSTEGRTKKKLSGLFNFYDVKSTITGVLDREKMTGKRTLQNIARYFGVYALRPKHNALSDARTLFNILSIISRKEFLNEET